MAFRQRISKLRGRKPKGNDESQVEQKFEWSCDSVQLVWIAPAHTSRVMVQGVGTGRQRVHPLTRNLKVMIMRALPASRHSYLGFSALSGFTRSAA